jgi:hypothetical protein
VIYALLYPIQNATWCAAHPYTNGFKVRNISGGMLSRSMLAAE